MAASELTQDHDVPVHIEANVTTSNTQTCPPRVVNGSPPRAAPPAPPAEAQDNKSRSERSRASSLLKQTQLVTSLSEQLRRRCDYMKISVEEEHAGQLPDEWWKTGVAFLYAFFNLIFTTVIITVVHERVPDKSQNPPLPDKFFDYVDRVPWAFTVTEANGLILVGLWLVQWLLLKHK